MSPNRSVFQVAEVVTICKANNWVQPQIYQVCVSTRRPDTWLTLLTNLQCRMYNAITREMEPELLPCCRKFGLRLVVYNPLALVLRSTFVQYISPLMTAISGGFFAGKISSPTQSVEGRFDPSGPIGTMYRARYLNDGYFEALKLLKEVAVSILARIAPVSDADLFFRTSTHFD